MNDDRLPGSSGMLDDLSKCILLENAVWVELIIEFEVSDGADGVLGFDETLDNREDDGLLDKRDLGGVAEGRAWVELDKSVT